MKKKFAMEGVDCAVCAERMAEQIRKLPGVQNASVNFLTQKLILEAEEAQLEAILAAAQKAVGRIDKGARILL
ncbi:MAG: cation transporter [Clostridia bacterium]|nr:cation transporter [Clostridia bacterium]